jgi:hypothetical protein
MSRITDTPQKSSVAGTEKIPVGGTGTKEHITPTQIRSYVTGSITAGSVAFGGSSGAIAQDNTNFFWDDTNNRLGIGTNAPASPLEINTSSSTVAPLEINNTNATTGSPLMNITSTAALDAGGGTWVSYYDIPVIINGNTGYFLTVGQSACFPSGTPITLSDGTTKPIENIEVGDKVLSMNEKAGFTFENEVQELANKPKHRRTFLTINGVLTATDNHKTFINGQWKPIGLIELGDYLVDQENNKIWVYSIQEYTEEGEGTEVYNFKVKGAAKNYFANGLLVHNKCPFLHYYDESANVKNPDAAKVYQTTFLYELDAPEKETAQRRKLNILSNKFLLIECEPETSYIKDMSLIAINAQGQETKLAWVNRPAHEGEYYTTKGLKHESQVIFEQLPEDTVELWVEAEGYYIWQGD